MNLLKSSQILSGKIGKTKSFKGETVHEDKYTKIRRFYEIKKDIKQQLGTNSPISPEQVIISLCKLKPDAKSFYNK
jgi:hypothetical protein